MLIVVIRTRVSGSCHNCSVTPEDARTLLTPEALALLDSLPPLESPEDVLRISTRLHKEGIAPALIAAALTQAKLRRRARVKFGEFSDRMLLTEDGVQQATRLPVAAAHASRLTRAGIRRVADLGCGIGADSLAFAAADVDVLAVDADPVTAAFAGFNLAPWPNVRVRQARAEDVDLARELGGLSDDHSLDETSTDGLDDSTERRSDSVRAADDSNARSSHEADGGTDMRRDSGSSNARSSDARSRTQGQCTGAVFLDPARRVAETSGSASHEHAHNRAPARGRGSHRTWNPEQFSPSLDWVFEVAHRWPTGVKLGPGLPHELIPDDAEAEWVSDNGNVVEVSLWFGALTEQPGARSALLHDDTGWHRIVSDGSDPQVGSLQRWLYEPDGAVIRARALGTLAQQHDLSTIDETIAYLTGSELVESPFMRGFEVLDDLPFDERKVKARLVELGVPRVTVKKRGAGIDPAALAKQWNRQLGKALGKSAVNATIMTADKQVDSGPADRHAGADAADESGTTTTSAGLTDRSGRTTDEAIVFVTRVAGRHRAIIARRI